LPVASLAGRRQECRSSSSPAYSREWRPPLFDSRGCPPGIAATGRKPPSRHELLEIVSQVVIASLVPDAQEASKESKP
jgi:hypothetical protein